MDSHTQQLVLARKRIQELEDALRPFAVIGKHYSQPPNDESRYDHNDPSEWANKIGDLRRAYLAYDEL